MQVGLSNDGVRVIRSGLEASDRVIVNGTKKVIPTMPVAPMTEPVASK